MVDYRLAKAMFNHVPGTTFRSAYEGSEKKGRLRCFETNNARLESWKITYSDHRPKVKTPIIDTTVINHLTNFPFLETTNCYR